MKILIVTQLFLPEMGALPNRIYPIVRELVAAGHEVYVATGMPNYPSGKVFPGYEGKLFRREEKDGYTILRTHYFTVPRNKSKVSQLLSYLSFMPSAFASGVLPGKLDVVFVSSPPLFSLIPAALLAKLRGAKFVSDIRDLWSDELITHAKMREDSLPVKTARAIESWGFRQADLITAVTQPVIETMVARGADRAKTAHMPNGADLELFRPLPPDNPKAAAYNFGDRFVVMYAGLFGVKHDLEMLLDAAEMLRDYKDIVFSLIGNGPRRDLLRQIVKDKNLENVIISDEISVEDVPYALARANVGWSACKAQPYTETLISVKIYEYMACKVPIVAAFHGVSAKVIEDSGSGIVAQPENARSTADAILKLYNSPELCREMGETGRRYVEEHASRSAMAKQFEQKLVNLLSPDAPNAQEQMLANAVSAPPQ